MVHLVDCSLSYKVSVTEQRFTCGPGGTLRNIIDQSLRRRFFPSFLLSNFPWKTWHGGSPLTAPSCIWRAWCTNLMLLGQDANALLCLWNLSRSVNFLVQMALHRGWNGLFWTMFVSKIHLFLSSLYGWWLWYHLNSTEHLGALIGTNRRAQVPSWHWNGIS